MSLLVSTAIGQMQQELNVISGQKMSDSDFLLFLDRANKYFYTNYKMPTSQREADLFAFSGVFEYALPSDFVGIIEPKRPYNLHSPKFSHTTEKEFLHWPYGRHTAIKWVRENAFLILKDTTGSSLRIHNCDDTDDNGTWTVSGDGASLAQDTQIFTGGEGSLRFTITGSGGSTTLVNSTLTAVDITDYVSQGYIFLDLQCPLGNTTALTSVRLRLGSDASNYYQITATTRHRGDTILGGWGLIGFDMSQKSTTGTPTDTAIDHVQILITHGTSGIDGTYRVDNIFAAEAVYFQLPYYSKNNVKDSSNSYIESPTSTSDTILCPSDFNEAYIYKTLEIAAAIRLKDTGLAAYFARELDPKEKYLKSKYPRQESRVQTTWYKNWAQF